MCSLDEIFCQVDDFCKTIDVSHLRKQLSHVQMRRHRQTRLNSSEIITILISYQFSKYRDFKAFYIRHVAKQWASAFPDLVSYNRFIELIPRNLPILTAFLGHHLSNPTGISFIDSTEIPVCHRKRISSNKVFSEHATVGKSSKGWFLGFKLHLLCNHLGGLVAVKITPGHTSDLEPVEDMTQHLFGRLYGDKGYISKSLSSKLLEKGVQLFTTIRKNMKPVMMSLFDRIVLKKRALIESVNNQLKNYLEVEHTRHRSPMNAFAHIISALVAYCLHPNKPSADIQHVLPLIDSQA